MKQFCYVIVNNAGHSWITLNGADTSAPREQVAPILPQLLQEGWEPVRETPMGGGTSHLAHSLILLEKAAAMAKAPRPAKAKK
jgi:hypothetical protein